MCIYMCAHVFVYKYVCVRACVRVFVRAWECDVRVYVCPCVIVIIVEYGGNTGTLA